MSDKEPTVEVSGPEQPKYLRLKNELIELCKNYFREFELDLLKIKAYRIGARLKVIIETRVEK